MEEEGDALRPSHSPKPWCVPYFFCSPFSTAQPSSSQEAILALSDGIIGTCLIGSYG